MRSRVAVTLVFVALAAIYGAGRLLSPVQPIQGDGYYTWLWAHSLAYDGDLDLANDYARCGDPWGFSRRGVTGGAPPNPWTFGPALLWAPLAWAGRALHSSSEGCLGPVPGLATGATVLAALLALWLGFVLARRHTSTGPALWATAGVGLASPLPYYAIYLPFYGHVPAAFALGLFVERWDATRGRAGLVRWLMLGVLLGLAMLMRPQLGVWVLLPLLEWGATALRWIRERAWAPVGWHVLGGVLFALGAIAVFSPQLALHHAMFGDLFAPAQGPHFMRWTEPELGGVLFGTTGGLLFWTPFLYLSVAGLVAMLFRRGMRPWAAAVLLALAATTYVNAVAWDWWGSMGFSNRRFTALTVVFVVGAAVVLAPVLQWAERRPRAAAAACLGLLLLGFASWNFAAMSGVATGRLKSWREQPADQAWGGVFDELATSVRDAVGNPLAWPASIPFALRYGVHPKHWDVMQGMEVFYVNYETLAPRKGEETVDFRRARHRQYLVEGFEPKRRKHRRVAVVRGERARMLVPLFIGAVRAVDVRWRVLDADKPARVVLRWNGTVVTQADVTGRWRKVRIALPEDLARTGVNELEWRVNGGRLTIRTIEMVPAEWLPPAVKFGESRLNDRKNRSGRSSRGSRR